MNYQYEKYTHNVINRRAIEKDRNLTTHNSQGKTEKSHVPEIEGCLKKPVHPARKESALTFSRTLSNTAQPYIH